MKENYALLKAKLNSVFSKPTGYSVTFECGEAEKTVLDVLTERFTGGKVAVLYYKARYRKGSEFTEALKNRGNKPVSVLMPEGEKNSVENFSRLFNLSEDVRAVVTFEKDLFPACRYFAALRGITCVLAYKEPHIAGTLAQIVPIINGNEIERVSLTPDTVAVVDPDKIAEAGGAELFAEVMSSVLLLAESGVSRTLGGKKINGKAVSVLSDAVKLAHSVYKAPYEKQCALLIESAFTAEYAEILSDGRLYGDSSLFTADFLAEGGLTGVTRMEFAKRMLAMYAEIVSSAKIRFPFLPDYTLRASALCEKTGIDDGYFLRAVSAQSDVFRKTLKRGDARSVLKTTAAFTGLIEKAEATYRALGGKDEPNEETLKLALKYSGDVFVETLAPAYLRESGYTELISV